MTEVNPIRAQKFLKGADYPMSREELVELARNNDAPQEILEALRSLRKESFDGPNAVTAAMKDAGVSDSGRARPQGAAGPSETEGQDAISLLIGDHRTVEELFEGFEQLGAGQTGEKRRTVDTIIEELSVHAAIEEQELYPFLRQAAPEGSEMADEGLEEHQEAKQLLSSLQQMSADAPEFDSTVAQLIADVRHHVAEEENEFLPRLREATSAYQLVELGRRLQEARSTAPTTPR
ncbi:MAG: hemerythrin domain-containing protein [Actinomycetota bacterium]|nr:hemerythrin domain-containing protein [Actinomycetota bacterium]